MRVAHEVLHEGMPKRLAEAVEGEARRCNRSRFDALDPFGTPVHVGEPQPQREFVHGEAEGYPKDERDPQMPRGITGGQRRKASHHQEEDAPEQMMNVQPALRDDVVEGSVRQ